MNNGDLRSASMLLAAVTVTANSSLSYCLCDNAVFIGDCPCDQAKVSPSKTKESRSCNCCINAHSNEQTTLLSDHNFCADSDCMINLSLQLNDFVSNAHDILHGENQSKPSTPIEHNQQEFLAPLVILPCGNYTSRGSSPSSHRLNVPIYIRDSVYRL